MSDDFTKVRMLYDKDYAHYRSHTCSICGNKCNKDRAEINDELNKKYSDSILSDEASEQSTSEHPAELISNEVEQDNAEVSQELNNAGVAETHDEAIPFVNDNRGLVLNNAERVISNQQDTNASLDEVSSSEINVDVSKIAQQVLLQSTVLSAVNFDSTSNSYVVHSLLQKKFDFFPIMTILTLLRKNINGPE